MVVLSTARLSPNDQERAKLAVYLSRLRYQLWLRAYYRICDTDGADDHSALLVLATWGRKMFVLIFMCVSSSLLARQFPSISMTLRYT